MTHISFTNLVLVPHLICPGYRDVKRKAWFDEDPSVYQTPTSTSDDLAERMDVSHGLP
jgi:hypothetical protein